MSLPPPFRYLIAGLGGYAGSHHEALLALENAGLARVVATCDPTPDRFSEQRALWRFEERGVRVFAGYDAMLAACAADSDVVVIPTPIPLHADMHRAAVTAGLAVYLEKPPTLDPAELEAMIAADAAARRPTLVGFNFSIEPARLALKTRLLAGEFGALRTVHTLAQWPRRTGYFRRNTWAGRLRSPDGRALLDSCLSNAMAHFTHNTLQWAGPAAPLAWGMPVEVRAQLARAHAIEGADTFLVDARTREGVGLRLAFTHAATGSPTQQETVRCEHATLTYVVGSHYEISRPDGRLERHALPPFEPLAANHREYQRCLCGETNRPATRLEDARPFVRLNTLAYLSAGKIARFAPGQANWTNPPDPGDRFVEIAGLSGALRSFLEEGRWLDPAFFDRGAPPTPPVTATATPADPALLDAVIARMAADAGRSQP